MRKKQSLLGQKILLTDWDWPNEKGPNNVVAKIVSDYGKGRYGVVLKEPIRLKDGSKHQKLIIEERHCNSPLTKIIPNLFDKLLSLLPFSSRMFMPFIAVNVFTENGFHFSIASVYLKSNKFGRPDHRGVQRGG